MDSLVQIGSTAGAAVSPKVHSDSVSVKPAWLKVPAPGGANYRELKTLITRLGLHTVLSLIHI